MQIQVSTDHTAPEPQQERVRQVDIALKAQDKALAPDCQQINHTFNQVFCGLVEDIHPFFCKTVQSRDDYRGYASTFNWIQISPSQHNTSLFSLQIMHYVLKYHTSTYK